MRGGTQYNPLGALYSQLSLPAPLGNDAFWGAQCWFWLLSGWTFFSAGTPVVWEENTDPVNSLHAHYFDPFVYGPIEQTLAWLMEIPSGM